MRGPVRTHRRPGARPPSERTGLRRREPALDRPSQLEIAEELAEDIVEDRPAEARAAIQTAARSATPASTRVHHKVKAGSLLAVRAATEYVYVSQDMRRIVVVAGGLIVVLFALWLLIVVMRVIPLPFY